MANNGNMPSVDGAAGVVHEFNEIEREPGNRNMSAQNKAASLHFEGLRECFINQRRDQ